MTITMILATGVQSVDQLTAGLEAGGPGALWGILAVLALIDSTTFGTLLIPVWLLMAPGRLRGGRVLAYLGTVAVGYAAIGLVLLASLTFFGEGLVDWFAEVRDTRAFLLGQALLGAGLLAYSFHLDPMTKAGRERKARREAQSGSTGRVTRWRARVLGTEAAGPGDRGSGDRGSGDRVEASVQIRAAGGGPGASSAGSVPGARTAARPAGVAALMGLALLAVLLEIGTVLPYLAGIGMVAAVGPEWPASTAMIGFYCLVMILPALVLLAGRVLARRAVQRPLERLDAWLSRHAAGMVSWVVGIAGVLLLLNALNAL
ncbi:GAP family protein [Nesterenkonia sp. HG001]|uniref:GAP family protein n=1 Tax=Nesterenkonia sp. HG001 TaxID=2983207 RepID=UPI002AC4CDBE|nr:GAP family protein [Nesterenkonia sp. HG001]MDZ5079045.1 GAP family protein [Nesterenkonia sp. HG001]